MAYISLAWLYSQTHTGCRRITRSWNYNNWLCAAEQQPYFAPDVSASLSVYFITSPSLYNNTSLWLYDATWREVIAGEEAYCLSLIERNSSSAYWMPRFFICFKALRSDFTQIVLAFGTRFLDRRLLHAQKSDTTQEILLNLG
jgi:hypothetical protein